MRRLLALLLLVLAAPAQAETPSLPWQKWDPALFDRAAREHRYVLLHMAAVWCHWCHVMEEVTYHDPEVQRAILDRFIPVRVDQDAEPELSYRYENWGWPATIMFDRNGNEILKRQGYIPPELFKKLLAAVIADPSALPALNIGTPVDPNALALSSQRRAKIEAMMLAAYDREHGGFGTAQHFIQGDTLEWALERSRPLKRNAERDVCARSRRRRSKARAS
jgi:uncharacterized protein